MFKKKQLGENILRFKIGKYLFYSHSRQRVHCNRFDPDKHNDNDCCVYLGQDN